MRGDVYRLRHPQGTRGHEQSSDRYAFVVQSDDLMLSTLLVAPTSRSAAASGFRPTVLIGAKPTQVLVEQTVAVDPGRLGPLVGHVSRDELTAIGTALRSVLALD